MLYHNLLSSGAKLLISYVRTLLFDTPVNWWRMDADDTEVITGNRTFDTDVSDWNAIDSTTMNWSAGTIFFNRNNEGFGTHGVYTQVTGLTIGEEYLLSAEVTASSHHTHIGIFETLSGGYPTTQIGGLGINTNGYTGLIEAGFTATTTTAYVKLFVGNDFFATANFDNISITPSVVPTEMNSPSLIPVGKPSVGGTSLIGDPASSSIDFNGTDQYYYKNISDYRSSDTQGSVEFWIKCSTQSSIGSIFSVCNDTTFDQVTFYITTSGEPNIWRRNDTDFAGTTAVGTVDDNSPHHVFFVFDGSEFKIYIDGVLDSTTDQTTDALVWFGDITTTKIYVGATEESGSGGPQNFFDGTIDELTVYDYPVTPTQVAEHYSEGSKTEYDDKIVELSPLSYWKLDETSGTTATDSIGTNHGTYVGSPTLGEPNLIPTQSSSKSVKFDRSLNQYVNFPDNPATHVSTITVTGWFKRERTGLGELITKGFGGGYSWAMRTAGLVTQWRCGGTGVRGGNSTNITSDIPTHFAVVYTSSSIDLYLDGVLDSNITGSSGGSGGTWCTTSTSPIRICARGDLSGAGYGDATVSNVAIFDKVLTPTEIADLYAAGTT